MKAILFARVSSREQEESGYSLPSQEKLLKEYAEKKGFKIVKIFSISESASGKTQRETFNEMMDYAQKNDIKIIICEKVDRLTRNLKDAVCVNEWINKDPERQVHFVKENCVLTKDSRSNDKFIWNIKVSVAQYYIDNLSEEVKKGQKEKLAQGWLPTVPPLGYKTTGEKGHKIHIVNKEKAPLIVKAFELYSTNDYSLSRLVETMHKEGLRTRHGNQLVKSRLANLLSDPFYCGKIRWKGEIYDGKHEPLITKELFDKVQDVLRGKSTPKYSKHSYLFKGLIRCAECGGTITWETHKGIIYGHCNHYKDCSQKTWAKELEIDRQTSEALNVLQIKDIRLINWVDKTLKEGHKDETEYHNSCLSKLNQQYGRLQKMLDKLYDDKLDDTITKETYNNKFQKLTEEKEGIAQAIQKHSNANTKYFELGLNVYELSQKNKEIYQKNTIENKRRLLGLIFGHIELDKDKLKFHHTEAFEVLLGAVNATNECSKVLSSVNLPVENFELLKLASNNAKIGAKYPDFSTMLRR